MEANAHKTPIVHHVCVEKMIVARQPHVQIKSSMEMKHVLMVVAHVLQDVVEEILA
jgi:hypothetical protein